MTLLELEGASELYNNFSHPMRLQDYLHWSLRTPINLVLARDILQQARQAGKVKMAAGMRIAILTGCMQLWLNRTIKKLLGPGLTYRIKRVVFKAEKDNNHS